MPKGKFPNFLDKAGQQILRKSLCDIEDTRKERRVMKNDGNFNRNLRIDVM